VERAIMTAGPKPTARLSSGRPQFLCAKSYRKQAINTGAFALNEWPRKSGLSLAAGNAKVFSFRS